MNDYSCTCSCGCENPADDYVCHNCRIGMCKVAMKKKHKTSEHPGIRTVKY